MNTALLLTTLAVLNAAPPALTDQNAEQVARLVKPGAEELRYEKIPWRITLWPAIQEANREDKPVLLWAMNGHPLGCV